MDTSNLSSRSGRPCLRVDSLVQSLRPEVETVLDRPEQRRDPKSRVRRGTSATWTTKDPREVGTTHPSDPRRYTLYTQSQGSVGGARSTCVTEGGPVTVPKLSGR